MKIKDLLKTAALYLKESKVLEALDGGDEGIAAADTNTLEKINVMTRLANLVISELASSYILMKKCEKISLIGGKFYYTSLSETPIKILSVKTDSGEELIHNVKHLYTEVFGATEVVVEYACYPSNRGLDDETGYTEADVSSRVLSLGLVSEICLVEGRFDEAVMWHKRYEAGIEAICTPKNKRIRERSFI